MLKQKGFTLIELLTVMTILGILFVITVPEYQRIRESNTFRAQNQTLWGQMATARSSALTNKKCPDGTVAISWQAVLSGIDDGSGVLSHALNCDNGSSLVVVEEATVLTDTQIDLLELDGTVVPDISTSNIADLKINFLSGSAQTRLEQVDTSATTDRLDSFRVVIGHAIEGSDLQQAICIERVAGFPTLNKSGNVCEADA